jgi:hypothetical protein
MTARTLLALPVALAAALSPSLAAAACPAISAPPLGADATLLELEGPLQTIDVAGRALSVFDTCVELPAGMLIDTSGDGVGDITIEQLANPALASAIGGTLAVTATAVQAANGDLRFVADAVYFEFAEHVIVGPLVSVDAAAGLFQVGNTLVMMNEDPRIPAVIEDLGANPISLPDLAGFEGTLVTVEGYYEANGVLRAKIVETEVLLTAPGNDTVAIERAQLRLDRGELDLRGSVTAQEGTGAVTATVALDVGCDNLDLITLTVAPGDITAGVFLYKARNSAWTTNPGTVCVSSPLGGTASRTLTTR